MPTVSVSCECTLAFSLAVASAVLQCTLTESGTVMSAGPPPGSVAFSACAAWSYSMIAPSG